MFTDLPIYDVIPQLQSKLSEGNTVILEAPPGAGKSTIVPLELLHSTWLADQKIIVLEPRRLAARAVASRMASLLNEAVGKTVGYRIRFETKISEETRIEVVTEGILTRMLQSDNSLEGIGAIIFDEFHERSLHADLGLALCREVQQVLREDLRLLIMSATLDTSGLSHLLNNAPVVTSEGRMFPVETKLFPEKPKETHEGHVCRVISDVWNAHNGDFLVFLPGAGEIERCYERLCKIIPEASVYRLYGNLAKDEQLKALFPDPSGKRKIVLATSIAETSLTIEGVTVVIDSGLSRSSVFEPRSGLTKLITQRITRDAADQRSGRAGRLGPGTCYRLWSAAVENTLIPTRQPEIATADLAPLMLEVYHWGTSDINSLSWLTPPPEQNAAQAKNVLHDLGAVEDNKLSDKGKKLYSLPTHPRIANMFLEAQQLGLVPLAADIAALLEEKDPLPSSNSTDINLRIEFLRNYRAKKNANNGLVQRIERIAQVWRKSFDVPADNSNAFDPTDSGRLLMAAYPERVAKQRNPQGTQYQLANNRSAKLDSNDLLTTQEWLVIAQLDMRVGDAKVFLAAPLAAEALHNYTVIQEKISWNVQSQELVSQEEHRYMNLLVKHKKLTNTPEDEKANAICKAILTGDLSLPIPEEIEALQHRISSLAIWHPEEEWPDISSETLRNTVSDWLAPYVGSVRKAEDLKKLDLASMVKNIVPWDKQQRINQLAPACIEVPSGSYITVDYQPDGSNPILSVRLQELFGLPKTPTVNSGQTSVLLHLLSPGYKPVQVTQDLESFWDNTYCEVKKELKRRYPKHSWPDDPWTAEAIRGAKRRK